MLSRSHLPDIGTGQVRASRVYLLGQQPRRAPARTLQQHRLLNGTSYVWEPLTRWQHNDMLYDADTVLSQLLRGSVDGRNYYVGGMYIEFDNSGGAVSPTPTISRSGNLSYYNTLNSGNPDRDYLRVPLVGSQLESSNDTNWPDGNKPTFFAMTAGTTGVHGNTFSDVAGSRVYGGALVAFCDPGDSSQDLIWARAYLASADQVEKLAGSQIGIDWQYTFT